MGEIIVVNFNLKEFEKTNTNTKKKIFIEYLYEKYGGANDNEGFDNVYFHLVNDDDLIESLEYYIAKNSITAQVTAENYITYIAEFFKMLSEEHGIENEVFNNKSLNNKFLSKSKKIIGRLKLSVSKDCASDEQYEKLNDGMDKFVNELVINDIYNEIIQFKDGKIKNIKLYNRFISIISIKLIMKFGISNLKTISLKFNDFDMIDNIVNVNGFRLELGKELTEIIIKYISVREYILKLYDVEQSNFFIKYNGTLYTTDSNNNKDKNKADYCSFFKIMFDIIDTRSADLFSTRTILEMLSSGIDISTIVKLTDKSMKKCFKLQNNNNDEYEINKKLQLFFYKDKFTEKKKIIKKKGYFKCPFCDNEVRAISDELVLVQFENDNAKYLACRECRGVNEKSI